MHISSKFSDSGWWFHCGTLVSSQDALPASCDVGGLFRRRTWAMSSVWVHGQWLTFVLAFWEGKDSIHLQHEININFTSCLAWKLEKSETLPPIRNSGLPMLLSCSKWLAKLRHWTLPCYFGVWKVVYSASVPLTCDFSLLLFMPTSTCLVTGSSCTFKSP